MSFFVFDRVKLISAGKVINCHQILSEQNLQNNQQIMAVILESRENLAENQAENAAYDRVQKAREDAQILINQKRHDFMQVSTQRQFTRIIPSSMAHYFRRWKIKKAMRFIYHRKNGTA